jgi:glycosyltransferase involved in cell wall biosynthesis
MVDVMAPRTLVVVPTFNEIANISELLHRVRRAAPQADVLVVDDDSPDGTADAAELVAAALGRISVLRRTRKDGLGAAYRAGFAWGRARGYEVLVEIDADLSHDPDVVPVLLSALANGADLAIGSRYVWGGATPDWQLHRRLLSRAGNRYARALLGLGVADATSGFRAYRAPALDRIDLEATRASGYAFQIELTYGVARTGGRIREVAITFQDRERGRSKMSARIAVEALLLVTWWAVRDRVLRRHPAAPTRRDDSARRGRGVRAAA